MATIPASPFVDEVHTAPGAPRTRGRRAPVQAATRPAAAPAPEAEAAPEIVHEAPTPAPTEAHQALVESAVTAGATVVEEQSAPAPAEVAAPVAAPEQTEGQSTARARLLAAGAKLGLTLPTDEAAHTLLLTVVETLVGRLIQVEQARPGISPARAKYERSVPQGLVKLAPGQKCHQHQMGPAAHGCCPKCFVEHKRAQFHVPPQG